MPHKQLDNLVKIGQFDAKRPSEQELVELIKCRIACLEDAKFENLNMSVEAVGRCPI